MNNQRRPQRRPCCPQSEMPKNELPDLALAMAYVPYQTWKSIYNSDTALSRGTIFEQLDLPFGGAR